jgi:hypothetical protein
MLPLFSGHTKLATVRSDETSYQWPVSLSLSFIKSVLSKNLANSTLKIEPNPCSEKPTSTYKTQRCYICIYYGTIITTILYVSF